MKFVIVSLSVLFLFVAGCDGSRSANDPNEMVLYHVLYTKIKGLDPGDMRDVYSMTVASQMFEQLYQYHFLKRPYEIVPLLADGMPQVSDDMLTYTIKIKRGVYFQDDKCFPNGKGRELKA